MIGKSLLKEVTRTVHGKALPVNVISDYYAGLSPDRSGHSSQIQLSSEPQREKLKSKFQFVLTLL